MSIEVDLTNLPKYIYYTAATDARGDYFTVEARCNGESLFRKKTTQSKKVNLSDKLNEAKTILVMELDSHPEWGITSPLQTDSAVSRATLSHKTTPTTSVNITNLPAYVRYMKATEKRGDGFAYERKTATERVVVESSRSNTLTTDQKYNDLLAKLSARGISF